MSARLDWRGVALSRLAPDSKPGPAPKPRPARYPAIRAFLVDAGRAALQLLGFLLVIGLFAAALVFGGIFLGLFAS